ncbi:MAG: ABC transporter ATP-binding protein, partial [Rhodobacteraceae bacterium]
GLTIDGATGLTLKLDGMARLPVGSVQDITFSDEDLHLFGKDGGRVNAPLAAE